MTVEHNRDRRYTMVSGWAAGLNAANYRDGGVTHLVVPLRVQAPSAEQAREAALNAGLAASDAACRHPGVAHVTRQEEAAYAMMTNLVTALAELDAAGTRLALLGFWQAIAPGDHQRLLELLQGPNR